MRFIKNNWERIFFITPFALATIPIIVLFLKYMTILLPALNESFLSQIIGSSIGAFVSSIFVLGIFLMQREEDRKRWLSDVYLIEESKSWLELRKQYHYIIKRFFNPLTAITREKPILYPLYEKPELYYSELEKSCEDLTDFLIFIKPYIESDKEIDFSNLDEHIHIIKNICWHIQKIITPNSYEEIQVGNAKKYLIKKDEKIAEQLIEHLRIDIHINVPDTSVYNFDSQEYFVKLFENFKDSAYNLRDIINNKALMHKLDC